MSCFERFGKGETKSCVFKRFWRIFTKSVQTFLDLLFLASILVMLHLVDGFLHRNNWDKTKYIVRGRIIFLRLTAARDTDSNMGVYSMPFRVLYSVCADWSKVELNCRRALVIPNLILICIKNTPRFSSTIKNVLLNVKSCSDLL